MDKSDNIDELKSELSEIEEEEEKDEEIETEEEKDSELDNLWKDDDEEEEKDDETDKDGFQMPDKFKGKKPEDIAKSYIELEKMIDKRAVDVAKDLIAKGELHKETKKTEEPQIKYPLTSSGEIDFEKFTPKQFKEYLLAESEKRAAEIVEQRAKKIFSDSDQLRINARAEIQEVRKEHPRLKKDREYTDLVLAIIESASAKGQVVDLKGACLKVEKLIGKQEKDKTRLDVETSKGIGAIGKKSTEEEKIINSFRRRGVGELGGLGF